MYFFVFAEMNLVFFRIKICMEEKKIFTIFFVVKFIEHNERYCKVMK